MNKFLVKIKNLSLITIVASVIIGLVLLIKPDEALQFVSLICGLTILILGIGCWVTYFAKNNSVFMAVVGTLSLIVGIFVCVKYKAIISFMLFIFGIFLVISGIIDLLSAVDAKRNDMKSWIISLIMSLAIIVMGIIVTVDPFSSMVLVTRLLGAALMAYAVLDLIALLQVKKIATLETVNDPDVDEVNISGDDIETK